MVKLSNLPKEAKLPAWFYATVVAVLLGFIYLYLLVNGHVKYAEVYVHCGWKQPVLGYIDSSFGGPRSSAYYLLPEDHYHIPKDVELLRSYTYFCSEKDAISSGYIHRGY